MIIATILERGEATSAREHRTLTFVSGTPGCRGTRVSPVTDPDSVVFSIDEQCLCFGQLGRVWKGKGGAVLTIPGAAVASGFCA